MSVASSPSSSAPGPTWTADQVGRVAAPLREQVVDLVRDAILGFRLQPGQRLVERELVEQLGVSRATVREVLRQLAAEGLVTVVPQRGAIVTALSPDDAADLYEMRAPLEALAVQRFVQRAAPEHVADLRAAVTEIERTAEAADPQAQLRAKDRFYEVLFRGSGSEPLQQTVAGLQARVRLLRATSLSEPGRPREAAAELRAVVDAVEAGDAARAAAACVQHIQNAARTALARLRTDS
ncbi:GntR family transcriptional regulator [Pseudonocardia broussonetiae]|uniref:GntR family transcriptional regulator n=1 Tax=Pseudonocardia broussonetiae TaxID=2736640 RepID=A0A6M6JLK1_9PSEU|nr:GntR family transcriptional regulator [Pseudonocardia broussonetiae]